ncbi:DUF2635 domain-containing protein [Pseudodesulfovibrio sp. JC047]|uniref:DUF2635 domain-containing protein n=1 Tax=Pseudodesulfovibrio sp. JC047 TaxID=2683199 RepID=UPI00193FCFDA
MAQKILYLKPTKGRVVRNPRDNKALPEHGKAVPAVSYWTRRLRDGDVETTTAQAVKKAEDALAKTAKEE